MLIIIRIILGVGVFIGVVYSYAWFTEDEVVPVWIKALIGVTLFSMVIGMFGAFSEERYFAAFIEITAALFITMGVPFLGFLWGALLGDRVYKKTSSKILGGIVFFSLMFSMIVVANFVGKEIPGVSWRIEKIYESNDQDRNSYWVQ